jgi:hypothetical protein
MAKHVYYPLSWLREWPDLSLSREVVLPRFRPNETLNAWR